MPFAEGALSAVLCSSILAVSVELAPHPAVGLESRTTHVDSLGLSSSAMPAWLPAAIAGGASIIGGLIGRDDAAKDRSFAGSQANIDRDLQREFAQHGVQWRAQDAERAGIHPVYAMGASLPSATPVSVSPGSRRGMGRAVASAGRHAAAALGAGEMRTQSRETHAANLRVSIAQAKALEAQAARDHVAAAAAASVGMRGAQRQGVTGDANTLIGPAMGVYQPNPGSPARDWEDRYGDAAFFDMFTLRAFDALKRSGEWAHRQFPPRLQTRRPRRLPPLPPGGVGY